MTIQSCHLQMLPTWNAVSMNLGQFKQGRDQEGGMLEKHTHRHSDIGVQRVWNSIIILFNHNQTKYSPGFYQELVWTVFLSRTSWAITVDSNSKWKKMTLFFTDVSLQCCSAWCKEALVTLFFIDISLQCCSAWCKEALVKQLSPFSY